MNRREIPGLGLKASLIALKRSEAAWSERSAEPVRAPSGGTRS